MQVAGSLVRTPGERVLSPSILRPVRGHPGRPRAEYVPVVRSEQDVHQLRRRKVPLYLVTDEWVTRSGYPVQFRPWLAVPESISGVVESSYRVLPVRDPAALEDPGLPELITFLLRFDALAARAVALRNRARLDANELYRRVRNEGLERAATRVRLQEIAPAIPTIGEPLPAEDLAWTDENNPALRPPA